jgi:hypothetical protein
MNPTLDGVASGSIDAGLNDKFIDAITDATPLGLITDPCITQGSRQSAATLGFKT